MANDLTRHQSSSELPTLPASTTKRIQIDWNADFDRPTRVVHSLEGAELEEARAILDAQLRPCGGRHAGMLLGKMKLLMAGRNMNEIDKDAWLAAMLEELAPLPADLVTKACLSWMRTERWLPTLADLMLSMDIQLNKRRMTRQALDRPANTEPPKASGPRATAQSIGEIMKRHNVGKSDPKASLLGPGVSSGQLSKAQAEAKESANQRAYWLEQMGVDVKTGEPLPEKGSQA